MSRFLPMLLLIPQAASAYELDSLYWSDGEATFRVAPITNASNKVVFEQAEAQFDQAPIDLDFDVVWDDENDVALVNGENEIAFVSNFKQICPKAGGGCTFFMVNLFTEQMVEADVFFDPKQAWTRGTDTSKHWSYVQGMRRPMLCTTLHEFGHAVGLDHENDRYTIMGTDWNVMSTNGDIFHCELGADGFRGLSAQYTDVAVRNDLGLSHFRYIGFTNDAQYSRHGRNRLFDSSNVELKRSKTDPDADVDGDGDADQPVYIAAPGQTIKVEVTLQNGSALPVAMPVRIVLSADNAVQADDVLLKDTTFVLTAGQVVTKKITVTIPSDAGLLDAWWIGAVADPDGLVLEDREDNNAIWVAKVLLP